MRTAAYLLAGSVLAVSACSTTDPDTSTTATPPTSVVTQNVITVPSPSSQPVVTALPNPASLPEGTSDTLPPPWFPPDLEAALGSDTYTDLFTRMVDGGIQPADMRHLMVPDDSIRRGLPTGTTSPIRNEEISAGDHDTVATTSLGGWIQIWETADQTRRVTQTAGLYADVDTATVAYDTITAGLTDVQPLLLADGSNVPDAARAAITDPSGCHHWAGLKTGTVVYTLEIRIAGSDCTPTPDSPIPVMSSMVAELRTHVSYFAGGRDPNRRTPEPGTHDRVRAGEITVDDLGLVVAIPERLSVLFDTGELTIDTSQAAAAGETGVPARARFGWVRESANDDVSFTQRAVLHSDETLANQFLRASWMGWPNPLPGVDTTGRVVDGTEVAQRPTPVGRCETRAMGQSGPFTIELVVRTPACDDVDTQRAISAISPVLGIVISTLNPS